MAHIQLDGDTGKAARWVPFARSLIRKFKRQDPTRGSYACAVDNGRTYVRVVYYGSQEWIYITASGGVIYLETGFSYYHNTHPSLPETYLPANVYFNSYLQSLPSKDRLEKNLSIDSLHSQGGVTSGFESAALGCASKDKVSSMLGSSSTVGYCPNILNKKRTQAFNPPGCFSGKLRKFVQAVYGANRNDYTSSGQRDTLSINGVSLPWGAPDGPATSINGVGLFTSEGTKEWVLIFLNRTGAYARKLEIPKIAKSLVSKYFVIKATDPEKAEKLESYIFAVATISPVSIPVTIDLSAIADGNPIAYSWKFNTMGTEASIVTHRYTINASGNEELNSYVFTATFVPSVDQGTGTVSGFTGNLAMISGPNRWDPRFAHVKVPCYSCNLSGLMEMSPPASSAIEDFDAPVYCWYDSGPLGADTLHIVNVKHTSLTVIQKPSKKANFCGLVSGENIIYPRTNSRTLGVYTSKYNFVGANQSPATGVDHIRWSNPRVVHVPKVGDYAAGTTSVDAILEFCSRGPALLQLAEEWVFNTPTTIPGTAHDTAHGFQAVTMHAIGTPLPGTNNYTTYRMDGIQYAANVVIPDYDCESVFVASSNIRQVSEKSRYRIPGTNHLPGMGVSRDEVVYSYNGYFYTITTYLTGNNSIISIDRVYQTISVMRDHAAFESPIFEAIEEPAANIHTYNIYAIGRYIFGSPTIYTATYDSLAGGTAPYNPTASDPAAPPVIQQTRTGAVYANYAAIVYSDDWVIRQGETQRFGLPIGWI